MEDEQNKTLEALQINKLKNFAKRFAKWRNYNAQQAWEGSLYRNLMPDL